MLLLEAVQEVRCFEMTLAVQNPLGITSLRPVEPVLAKGS